MSFPRFTVQDFAKSVDPETPQLFYSISQPSKFGTHLGPAEDFEVDFLDGEKPVLLTITRGFYDRGVQCVEYRPAGWVPNHVAHNLRVRFYSPGIEYRDSYMRKIDRVFSDACLTSCRSACKKVCGEDCGE